MIYHVLTEAEPFSEYFGGAISRWVANVLRDDERGKVVCPWADSSWGFPPDRIVDLSRLNKYRAWLKIFHHRMAIDVRLMFLRSALKSFCQGLNKGDTVYIHNRPEYAISVGEICRRKGIKIVLHMHNSHLLALPLRYQRFLNVDALVFCSEFLRSEAPQCTAGLRESVVIPNGADETSFFPAWKSNPNNGDEPVILFVGRLVPDKGVHVFVEAMRLLKQDGVEACGRIIGDTKFGHNKTSSYVDALKKNKPENVEFIRYISGGALGIEFRNACIFCCPSVFNEPFGMVNVEAMATGLPVVASAVGGIPEVFREGGGVLIPAGSASELATAIRGLIQDPKKRRELSEQGYRAFQKHYRWQLVRSQYHDLIGSVSASA
jgi:spore coat protein SA